MNRSHIVDEVAKQVGSKVLARAAVDAMVDTINRGLAEDGRVHVSRLGTFVGEQVPSRWVRNPATGKKVHAPKGARVRFRPSTFTKEMLAGRLKPPRRVVTPDSR